MAGKHICNKEREIGMILQEFKDFKEDWKGDWKEIKEEIKKNSEFRIQSKSILGAISFASALLGGFFIWLFGKFWPK